MRTPNAIAIVLLFLLADARCEIAAAEPPIALHPENGHYFVWRGRPTLLITSGEHYGAVLNLDFDYKRYLAALAADGLNHTRLFSGTYREVPGSFKITDNTLAPHAGRYLCPWVRSDSPGYAGGGNKFDLMRWDDAYFARLRQFMLTAKELGVVVEYNLFCPLYDKNVWAVSPMNAINNVNEIGNCPRDETLSLKHPEIIAVQEAFVHKMVRELNEFDNLYYEVCNEPYVRNLPDDWQHHIVDVIVAAEQKLPNRHLISLNVANGRKKIDHPHSAVSIFNFHYCVPPDAVTMNFGLNKVIGENETGFRGRDDYLYRSEGWNFILAGGGLYNSLDYSFTAAHPEGDFLEYRSPGGGSPNLRKQLGVLMRFVASFEFVRMAPHNELVLAVPEKMAASVLAEPTKAYAVYLHVPPPPRAKNPQSFQRENSDASITVKLPEGRYAVEWLDTLTGAILSTQNLNHRGGPIELRSPKFSQDIALKIVAENNDRTTPAN